MKLHVVAASDIIQKGLDLSFPHNELGEDGLLVPPPVDKQLEPVEVPELVDQSSQEGLDVPALEEEKKTGKKTKKS